MVCVTHELELIVIPSGVDVRRHPDFVFAAVLPRAVKRHACRLGSKLVATQNISAVYSNERWFWVGQLEGPCGTIM